MSRAEAIYPVLSLVVTGTLFQSIITTLVAMDRARRRTAEACVDNLVSRAFMVLLLGIDGPDVVLGPDVPCDVVRGGHGRKHGMIHVVVPVHAVAADEEQILELIRE
jgi:hypothetical protein